MHGRIAALFSVCYLVCVAKKQTRRPTTVPSASAVRNPKGKGAKPGLFDLPDAGDIWDQINFWSGRGDQTRPEMVNQARDITSAVVGTGVQALDAQYTAGLGGSLYNNVLRPRVDINSRTNPNYGRFGRDVAVTGATAGAVAALGKGVQTAAQNPTLQHYGNRVLNAIRGETVGLHGSPTTGIKMVEPRWAITDTEFPTVSIGRTDIPQGLKATDLVEKYTFKPDVGQGSVYVVKADKNATALPKFPKDAMKDPGKWTGDPTVYTKSTRPTRVVSEIPMAGLSPEKRMQEIADAVYRAGSSYRDIRLPVPPDTRQRIASARSFATQRMRSAFMPGEAASRTRR